MLPADGVVDAVRDLTDGRGADLVIDFVGSDATHADGMGMLARLGTYSIVGFGGTLCVPVGGDGRHRAGGDRQPGRQLDGPLGGACSCTARGRLTLKTETHPLEAVNDVLDRLRAGDDHRQGGPDTRQHRRRLTMPDAPTTEFWRDLEPITKVFQPDALPEAYIQNAPTDDDRYYAPITETVSTRPLWISPSQNKWADILMAKEAGLVNRHYHPHEVFAFTVSGKWGYLEHDWTATAGDFVYETPGEGHTLVAYDHPEPMRVFFVVKGPLVWLDEDGEPVGYFDVHDYIKMCKEHYEQGRPGRRRRGGAVPLGRAGLGLRARAPATAARAARAPRRRAATSSSARTATPAPARAARGSRWRRSGCPPPGRWPGSSRRSPGRRPARRTPGTGSARRW